MKDVGKKPRCVTGRDQLKGGRMYTTMTLNDNVSVSNYACNDIQTQLGTRSVKMLTPFMTKTVCKE